MHLLLSRNVQQIIPMGVDLLREEGYVMESRAGEVVTVRGPVTSFYERPTERVIFWPERDANPFFHFMEGLWMLDGRNDVEWISRYNSTIEQFSDNGRTFNGAYGHRWRHYFGYDQLNTVIDKLRANPEDRRVMLQMWHPDDMVMDSKDLPCNQSVNFRIVSGQVDMTVFNRSNDMIWGAYGANAVHMSMLQEYVALSLGLEVGGYWQISTNFHAYHSTWDKVESIEYTDKVDDPYESRQVEPFKMMHSPKEQWDGELEMFMDEGTSAMGYRDPFFKKVVLPMAQTWDAWKEKDMASAMKFAKDIGANDWQRACLEWLARRNK